MNKLWECTVFIDEKEIPNGSDAPPRTAAIEAIESMGLTVTACSSAWGCEEFTPKIAALKKRIAELERERDEFAIEQQVESLLWVLSQDGLTMWIRYAIEERVHVLRKGGEQR